jgi:folate-binding protein YgfZ
MVVSASTTEPTTAAAPLAGAALDQYNAVRNGGFGWHELSGRGLVEVTGSEAVQFLNGLITNDVKTLEPGHWMSAAFPNVQGRLIASVRVLRRGDAFLFDTEPATRDAVYQALYRFSFAGDFHVTDLSEGLTVITAQGQAAAERIEKYLRLPVSGIGRSEVLETEYDAVRVSIIRHTHTAEDGFDLFVDEPRSGIVRDCLSACADVRIDAPAWEVLRIEAGVPVFGVDMNETNVVSEVVTEDAVSFTKGCYVGQEIIARIRWRGHVAKKLTGLKITGGPVAPDDKLLTAEGKEVGRITSVAYSPALGQWVALGLVKYDQLPTGTELRVAAADGEGAAIVSGIPLVHGSWVVEEPAAAAGE